MRRQCSVFVAILAMSGSLGQAQSLGDVAKQEEARRKAVTSTGKVYTNDSLRPEGSRPVPAPAPAAPAAAATDKGTPSGSPPATSPAQDEKKNEKYWRARVTQERDALNRSQTFAEALQTRINALTADFAAKDDPFQRNQVSADRQKALAELDRVRKEIADHTKAIAAIQEEARKAGVPAGWVR